MLMDRAHWGMVAVLAAGVFLSGAGASAVDRDAKTGATTKSEDFVDRMIKEGWDEAKIKPSKVAPEPEFMRRAYLDVLGRVPNIQEATAYLESRDAGKRAKLVEYLLAHPDYAKNFGNIWTVSLIGRQRQERQVDRPALSAWLRRQFADNRPWDKVAYELITAKGSNKDNGAVNFTLAHMESGAVPLTSTTTRVFLGQQIQCTQCHDHPSNDWKQADFWGVNAFFKGLTQKTVRKENAAGLEVDDYTELSQRIPEDPFVYFDKRNAVRGAVPPTFLDGRKINLNSEADRRVEFAKFVTEPTNANFPKSIVNRMWAHFLGRGFVSPVDDFGPHNPPSHPELLDKLAEEFQASGYDIKKLVRRIMETQAYNQTSVTTPNNEKDDTLFSHVGLKPMSPEQLFDSLLTATSAHKAGGGADSEKRRDAWLGQFIFAFANDEGEESSSFQGTIPQALMMMNGELMEKAVGGKPGSFLADLLEKAQLQSRTAPEIYVINHMYLAALARPPSARELTMARNFLNSSPDTIRIMEDLFWALLNSNEFVLNR